MYTAIKVCLRKINCSDFLCAQEKLRKVVQKNEMQFKAQKEGFDKKCVSFHSILLFRWQRHTFRALVISRIHLASKAQILESIIMISNHFSTVMQIIAVHYEELCEEINSNFASVYKVYNGRKRFSG